MNYCEFGRCLCRNYCELGDSGVRVVKFGYAFIAEIVLSWEIRVYQ
jgi:hypothetical protein